MGTVVTPAEGAGQQQPAELKRTWVKLYKYEIFELSHEHGLTANEQHVLWVLAMDTSWRTHTWQGTIGTIVERSHLSRSVASKAAHGLAEKGLISWDRPFGPNRDTLVTLDVYETIIAPEMAKGRPRGTKDSYPRTRTTSGTSQRSRNGDNESTNNQAPFDGNMHDVQRPSDGIRANEGANPQQGQGISNNARKEAERSELESTSTYVYSDDEGVRTEELGDVSRIESKTGKEDSPRRCDICNDDEDKHDIDGFHTGVGGHDFKPKFKGPDEFERELWND